MRVHDGRQWLFLDEEIGRGGEGTVLAVAGQPHLAAKIYSTAPDEERCEKLRCMVTLFEQSPELADNCAWPERLISDETGQLRGFLMQRLADQHPVHELYNPEQRKQTYPRATWESLARAAQSCAHIFASLHQHGVVVGDVNERNVLVAGDGTLRLVDCDSFQIQFGDTTYLTGVGVVDYTPPELQGADFRGAVRTANHDAFGLAVLLFKLVFMGRHPFSGGASGDMGAAIATCAYDYPELAHRLKHLVPIGSVPGSVRAMFDLAFADEGIDGGRPTAVEWAQQLEEMATDLQPCGTEPMHRVPSSLSRCPWCLIEATLHYAYFLHEDGEHYVSSWAPRMDEVFAQRLAMAQVPSPPEPSSLQNPDCLSFAMQMARRVANADPPPHQPSWHVQAVGGLAVVGGSALLTFQDLRYALTLATVGVLVWILGKIWNRLHRQPWLRRIATIESLHRRVLVGADHWQAIAHQRRNIDRQLLEVFAQFCEQHEAIVRYRLVELERLAHDNLDETVRPQLEQEFLEDASLPAAITVERLRSLLIRGMVTAADVDRTRLAGLPGMTRAAIDELVGWRQSLEIQLGGRRKPKPRPEQYAAIDHNCLVMQEEIEVKLQAVVGEREAVSEQSFDILEQLHGEYVHDTESLAIKAEQLWLQLRGQAAG